MNISIAMIVYKLRTEVLSLWTPPDGGAALVRYCRFISPGQQAFRADCLYICRAAELVPFISSEQHLNAVVLGQNAALEPMRAGGSCLIFVPEETGAVELNNELQDIFDFYNEWDNALRDTLIHLEGLQGLSHLLNFSYRVFDNPMYIIDESFRTLGYTQEVPADAIDKQWASIILDGHSHIDTVNAMKEKDELDMLDSHGEPIINTSSIFPNHRINANIMSHGEKAGTLIVIEAETPLHVAHLHMASHLVEAIRTAMEKDITYQSTRGPVFRFFIVDMLEGKPLKRSNIEYQLKLFNWRAEDRYHVLKVQPMEQDLKNNTLHYLSQRLKAIFPDSQHIIYQKYIVMIIRTGDHDDFQRKVALLRQSLKDNGLSAGLSNECRSFSAIHNCFLQATAAMKLSVLYGREDCLVFYRDYVVEHLLSVAAQQVDLAQFLHPSILTLQEYDRSHHTDYLNDLRVYLKNNKNLVDSARERFIHRNTFVYHINKIHQLVDVDLSSEREKTDLLVSFKILDHLAHSDGAS